MQRHLQRGMLAAVAAAILATGAGCTNWGDHTKWPKKLKFEGVEVALHQSYLTGDHDTDEVQRGQRPATYHTYYSYVKDGEEFKHGKSTWWYEKGLPKAETVYRHGKPGDSTSWYYQGGVRNKTLRTEDGERQLFRYPNGKLFGKQLYDRKKNKLTFLRNGKKVSKEDFMFELGKEIYGVTRITP